MYQENLYSSSQGALEDKLKERAHPFIVSNSHNIHLLQTASTKMLKLYTPESIHSQTLFGSRNSRIKI